jgi:hypothetical protein
MLETMVVVDKDLKTVVNILRNVKETRTMIRYKRKDIKRNKCNLYT